MGFGVLMKPSLQNHGLIVRQIDFIAGRPQIQVRWISAKISSVPKFLNAWSRLLDQEILMDYYSRNL